MAYTIERLVDIERTALKAFRSASVWVDDGPAADLESAARILRVVTEAGRQILAPGAASKQKTAAAVSLIDTLYGRQS